ncbi:MAG: nucleotidyltransferase family protein [Gemmatimonadota bacterium]|nr:nucleotidyltransferase family protein [Gemmatimonadota bacterium]
MALKITVPKDKIAAFCRRNKIRRLALFGSVLRDDFTPESDVDVLVEFEPGFTPGLEIVDVEDELSQLLGGRHTDFVNPKYLNVRIRDRVLVSAETIYEKE